METEIMNELLCRRGHAAQTDLTTIFAANRCNNYLFVPLLVLALDGAIKEIIRSGKVGPFLLSTWAKVRQSVYLDATKPCIESAIQRKVVRYHQKCHEPDGVSSRRSCRLTTAQRAPLRSFAGAVGFRAICSKFFRSACARSSSHPRSVLASCPYRCGGRVGDGL